MKGKTGKEKWKRLWAGILVLVLLCGNPVLAAEQEEAASPGLQDIYYEWQTEEEILALCDQGLDLEDFFQYTIWGFLTREDLETLIEQGKTLDDMYASMPMALSEGDKKIAGFSGSVSSALGSIPALGNGSHGPMLKIHLSGETAFCARFGAACRTGMVYMSVPLAEIGVDSGKERIIRGLLAQYAQAQSIYTGPANYIMTQAGIWLVQNGRWSGDPEQMAAEIKPLFSKTTDCPSVEFAADYFRAIAEWIDKPENQSLIEAVGLEAWANGPNQYLITATGEGGPIEEVGGFAHAELEKKDSETGKVITHDAQFTIYEWNGGSFEKSEIQMNREGEKYLSDDLFYTEENQGKFYIEESQAPADGNRTGYYGDFEGGAKRRYEVEVEKTMKGEAIVLTNQGGSFLNERVVGSIAVKKVDIEADAYVTGEVSHGIAELDGAIYDLYAKEAIVHPDGVTGVLYQRGALVASGEIQDGSCTFENLYLGSYYVKERQKGETLPDRKKLSYAEGYLLDETEYPVLLPYEGEAVKEVHREVRSNREQVIKAKAVFEKVESATGQGNIAYLQGAGFTIYRVDRLKKQASFIPKGDGTYDEESIRKAYLVKNYDQDTPKYNFSGEEGAIAAVYLRDTMLREDTAHYWQDGQRDIREGKLKPLGTNHYQVAELFSDKNGQIVTPYLPYAQYLAVETTVPKDHMQSPPFLLTFREGRSETVVTAGITEQTSYGYNFLKSGGDSVKPMEAVYFSGIIDNEAVEQLLKICKKDADTGKTVLLADTKFKIARIDDKTGEKTYLTHTSFYPGVVNRQVFSTNGEGYLQLPELLPTGTYVIEEVEGPNGFYNDVPAGYVTFKVTTDRKYQAMLGTDEGSVIEGDAGSRDVLLIIEEYFNRETRGVLTLKKQGEVLTDYREVKLLQKLKAAFGLDAKKQFVYEELPLAGAEYTIRAAEDIVTQDRQIDERGERTLWFKKGETVAVVTTGETGQVDEVQGHPIVAVSHEGTLGSVKVVLPLGSYEIEETKAPYGYTRTEGVRQVTFTWEYQFQEFIVNSFTITNARVKAVPEEETEKPGIGIYKRAKEADLPLAGITFGLYTVDPIYTKEGEKLLAAGELLGTCITGAAGKAVFDVDVPIRDEGYPDMKQPGTMNSGRYEIRELSAPGGVLLDETPIPVLFTYVDDSKEFVVLRAEQRNVSSEVFVSKQDLGGQELKGAELNVTEDWSGRTIHSWISNGTKKELRGLEVNEGLTPQSHTYTLTESAAPAGYLKAESIRFQLVKVKGEEKNRVYIYNAEAAVWQQASDNTVVMKDRPGITPEKPSRRKHTPSPAVRPVPAPVTGDPNHPGFWLLVVLASLSCLFLYDKKQRRQ